MFKKLQLCSFCRLSGLKLVVKFSKPWRSSRSCWPQPFSLLQLLYLDSVGTICTPRECLPERHRLGEMGAGCVLFATQLCCNVTPPARGRGKRVRSALLIGAFV